MSQPFDCRPHDIVQANPETTHWGPALVVVEEVRTWGVVGYTDIPRSGRAPIRLTWEQIAPTGGTVAFKVL